MICPIGSNTIEAKLVLAKKDSGIRAPLQDELTVKGRVIGAKKILLRSVEVRRSAIGRPNV